MSGIQHLFESISAIIYAIWYLQYQISEPVSAIPLPHFQTDFSCHVFESTLIALLRTFFMLVRQSNGTAPTSDNSLPRIQFFTSFESKVYYSAGTVWPGGERCVLRRREHFGTSSFLRRENLQPLETIFSVKRKSGTWKKSKSTRSYWLSSLHCFLPSLAFFPPWLSSLLGFQRRFFSCAQSPVLYPFDFRLSPLCQRGGPGQGLDLHPGGSQAHVKREGLPDPLLPGHSPEGNSSGA